MERKTDAELVALASHGDRRAFDELARRHLPRIQRALCRLIASRERAHELAHEALLQAYLSLPNLREPVRFGNWVYGIALNYWRNHARQERVDPQPHPDLESACKLHTPDPRTLVEQRELWRRVLDVMETLPPGQRDAALLFYLAEFSVEEVAAALGASAGAVKVRLHKAREQLRKQLAPDYPAVRHRVRPTPRRTRMVPVSVADVLSTAQQECVLVLGEPASRRALFLWIGIEQGYDIAIGLRQLKTERPITSAFFARILESLGATLEEVSVVALKDAVFYAVARLRSGERAFEVDARPSDAVALAVRAGSRISVAEEVLSAIGIPLPEAEADLPTAVGQAVGKELKPIRFHTT